MNGHKRDHSWVIITEEQPLHYGIHIPRNSNIVHRQDLINIAIHLEDVGHLVLN